MPMPHQHLSGMQHPGRSTEATTKDRNCEAADAKAGEKVQQTPHTHTQEVGAGGIGEGEREARSTVNAKKTSGRKMTTVIGEKQERGRRTRAWMGG